MPLLPNAKYSWFYFLVSIAVSTAVFGWWSYKRFRLETPTSTLTGSQSMADVEAIDASLATDGHQDVSQIQNQNRLVSLILLEAAAAEHKALREQKESGEVKDEEEHGEREKEVFLKILMYRRCAETGEDPQMLLNGMGSNEKSQ